MSDEKRKEKIKNLRVKLREAKKKNASLDSKMKVLNDQIVHTWDIESKLMNLCHRFKVGDWVVTHNKEIARIERLIGYAKYNIFVPLPIFKGHTGTTHVINEKQILCHVAGLDLSNCSIKFSRTKWSQRPEDDWQ